MQLHLTNHLKTQKTSPQHLQRILSNLPRQGHFQIHPKSTLSQKVAYSLAQISNQAVWIALALTAPPVPRKHGLSAVASGDPRQPNSENAAADLGLNHSELKAVAAVSNQE